MRAGLLIFLLGVCAACGWSQPAAGVSGPVTGFVFDAPSGALRSMMGIPGAAYIGRPVTSGLESAAVSPDGASALAVAASGRLMLYRNLRTAPEVLPVAGAIANPDHFAWAADSIAVYSSRTGRAQFLAHLDSSPSATASLDLSALPGPVNQIAFDGQHLVLAVAGDSGGIYLAAPGAAAQRIAASPHPSAMVLSASNLYFADVQQISEVRNYAGASAAVPFASDSTLRAPSGLQLSSDGRRLYVADSGARTLSVFDTASGARLEKFELNFVPTRLDRFGDASVYLMNDAASGPFYVVRDGGAGKTAIFFVPVPVRPHIGRPPGRHA